MCSPELARGNRSPRPKISPRNLGVERGGNEGRKGVTAPYVAFYRTASGVTALGLAVGVRGAAVSCIGEATWKTKPDERGPPVSGTGRRGRTGQVLGGFGPDWRRGRPKTKIRFIFCLLRFLQNSTRSRVYFMFKTVVEKFVEICGGL